MKALAEVNREDLMSIYVVHLQLKLQRGRRTSLSPPGSRILMKRQTELVIPKDNDSKELYMLYWYEFHFRIMIVWCGFGVGAIILVLQRNKDKRSCLSHLVFLSLCFVISKTQLKCPTTRFEGRWDMLKALWKNTKCLMNVIHRC